MCSNQRLKKYNDSVAVANSFCVESSEVLGGFKALKNAFMLAMIFFFFFFEGVGFTKHKWNSWAHEDGKKTVREKIKEGKCFFPLLSVVGIHSPKNSRWLSQHCDENHFCSSRTCLNAKGT